MSLLWKITFLPEHFSFFYSEEGFCWVLWSTVQPLMANKKPWTSHMLFLLLGHTFHPHPSTTLLTIAGLTPLHESCFFSTGSCSPYMLPSQCHERRTGRKWSHRNQERRMELVKVEKFWIGFIIQQKISSFLERNFRVRKVINWTIEGWGVNKNKLQTLCLDNFKKWPVKEKEHKGSS